MKISQSTRKATAAAIAAAEGTICPLCRWRQATELHEIVPRGHLSGSPEAMKTVLASPILCALVCRECHPAGNDASNWQLMAHKRFRYGEEAVTEAFAQVNEHLLIKLNPANYGVPT